jgi:hypothetical protein
LCACLTKTLDQYAWNEIRTSTDVYMNTYYANVPTYD